MKWVFGVAAAGMLAGSAAAQYYPTEPVPVIIQQDAVTQRLEAERRMRELEQSMRQQQLLEKLEQMEKMRRCQQYNLLC